MLSRPEDIQSGLIRSQGIVRPYARDVTPTRYSGSHHACTDSSVRLYGAGWWHGHLTYIPSVHVDVEHACNSAASNPYAGVEKTEIFICSLIG